MPDRRFREPPPGSEALEAHPPATPDRSTPPAFDAVALAVAPAAILDLWPWPLLVLHDDGRPLFANAAARRTLQHARGGVRVDGPTVVPVEHDAAPRWRDALRAAAAGEPGFVRLGPGGVGPIASLSCAPVTHGVGLVVCVLEGGDALATSRTAAYARMHGLTGSEAQVLTRLAAGESVKRIATRRGSSEATVRSQVKAILAKTSQHSIREAVTDLLRCPPLLDSDEASLAG